MDNCSIMERVAYVVCSEFNITINEIRSSYRGRNVAEARQIIAYVCVSFYKIRLREVGKFINRDHSSVIHSCKQAVLPHMINHVTRIKRLLNIV